MSMPPCSSFPRAVGCLLAAVFLVTAGAWAETGVHGLPAVPPSINKHYLNADVKRWQGIFESPGREVFDRRMQIVNATGVRPGMVVADVGAGTGFFSLLFARAVGPTGKVFAVDISETFIADIRRRAAGQGMVNLEAIVNDQSNTRLPAGSVDLVFVCDTYHHFEYPRVMLDSISGALREGGELVVIDFRRVPGVSNAWIMSHVRSDRDQVVQEVRAAGFDLVEERDFLRRNFFLRFRKGRS